MAGEVRGTRTRRVYIDGSATPSGGPGTGVTLYDGSGTLITATTNGADHGLDINVINDTVVVSTGSGVPANIVPVGGSDGSNARVALFTAAGELITSVTDMSGGDTLDHNAATLTGSAVELIAANAARRAFQIINTDPTAANICYWGKAGVTTTTGTPILANYGRQAQSGFGCYTGAVYIIGAGSGWLSNGIRWLEVDKA